MDPRSGLPAQMKESFSFNLLFLIVDRVFDAFAASAMLLNCFVCANYGFIVGAMKEDSGSF